MKSMIPKIFAVFVLSAIVAFVGCSRRENPAVPETPPAGLVTEADHQYDGITGSAAVWSGVPARKVRVYTPPGYPFQTVGPRYPVLYLLPGFDGEPSFNFDSGNENYYMASAVAKVADRLIASGEIKPMLICMPDASIYYGGSFYADSPLAGKWEDMMARELIRFMDSQENPRFLTIPEKESRGIFGHSSGGYGALRIAMKYDTLFNSVSAIDAPLAFAGDCDTCGIRSLFNDYLAESSIDTQAEYDNTDTTGFREKPFKILLYSMAATYTPAPQNLSTRFGSLRISLPFDYQGHTVQPFWDQWLANDLLSWLDGPNGTAYRAVLSSQHLHFETSDHDVNGFNRQTVLFQNKLTSLGINNYESSTFAKYPGYDAQSRSFLYDRLEGILKFHDRYLRDRDGKY